MRRFIGCLCMTVFFSISLGLTNQARAQVRQQPVTSRLYFPLSSNLTAVKEGESVSLITKDYLSSTRNITIDNKQLTFDYYPYGSSLNPRGQIPNSTTDKLFTGHRKLDGVSVYHAGARYYSPTLGSFIQPDTVEGPNRYAYVRNNPIVFNDPTGNCVQCDVWWMREYITGDHPWRAQPFSSNPSLATLGHVDAWSGIPSLLIGLDMQDNALDALLSDSKQYVSKSEKEAAFMVNMGVLAVGGAEGLAGLEGVGAAKSANFGKIRMPEGINLQSDAITRQVYGEIVDSGVTIRDGLNEYMAINGIRQKDLMYMPPEVVQMHMPPAAYLNPEIVGGSARMEISNYHPPSGAKILLHEYGHHGARFDDAYFSALNVEDPNLGRLFTILQELRADRYTAQRLQGIATSARNGNLRSLYQGELSATYERMGMFREMGCNIIQSCGIGYSDVRSLIPSGYQDALNYLFSGLEN